MIFVLCFYNNLSFIIFTLKFLSFFKARNTGLKLFLINCFLLFLHANDKQ